MGALLALGSFGSLFSMWRQERRAEGAYSLATRGEMQAQHRADEVHQTFLEGSKTTLELVNQTLTLAKEASERAARFLEDKATETLRSLDTQARKLLEDAASGGDRELIRKPRQREVLRSLAQKVNAFEINRFMLPSGLELTPSCLFIRGMEYHLDQQFQDALTCWQEVALNENARPALRSLASYWIGYEYNNRGNFDLAAKSFRSALREAEGARRWELERIILETRFFGASGPEETISLIEPLEALLKRIEKESWTEEIASRRRKIIGTLGNVLFIAGEEARRGVLDANPMDYYQRAIAEFRKTREEDKWARFGLAEALYRLEEREAAFELFRSTGVEDARQEAISRVEPRTKVLAQTTELICAVRVPDLEDRIHSLQSQVLEALGHVDERLTVYSQMQRRNVSKEEFLADLRDLVPERSGTPSRV